MIVIHSALSQDKIIALVNSLSYGEVTFSYQEKKGIQLFFEVKGTEVDLEDIAKKVKQDIKKQDWASVLFFQCVAK